MGYEQNSPGELAAVVVEIGRAVDVDSHNLAAFGAVGAWGPGPGNGEQGDLMGRGHVDCRAAKGPSSPEFAPGFDGGVDESPVLHGFSGPLVRLAHVVRAGKTGADDVREIAEGVHDW